MDWCLKFKPNVRLTRVISCILVTQHSMIHELGSYMHARRLVVIMLLLSMYGEVWERVLHFNWPSVLYFRCVQNLVDQGLPVWLSLIMQEWDLEAAKQIAELLFIHCPCRWISWHFLPWKLEGSTSPGCLLIGQYPCHMTHCPPVAIVKRCYESIYRAEPETEWTFIVGPPISKGQPNITSRSTMLNPVPCYDNINEHHDFRAQGTSS